jgi:hypothetical protein
MKEVTGEFTVVLTPQMDDAIPAGRLSIEKTYSGPLSGTGKGQMLSKRTAEEGSAGYVALEDFVGSLENRSGGFTLIHFGVMTRGASELVVQVVPDSGTGDLAGIAGKLHIDIVGGQHRYRFSYTLSA